MKILKDEAGVEPTALKIMAGVVLLVIGLGIGVAVYKMVGGSVTAMKVDVSLAQSSTTIAKNNTDNIQVDVTLIMGTTENVTLYTIGVPDNVAVTFSPPSGKPPFYSTMKVSVGSTAAPGTYTLTVLAKTSSGATSGSVPFDLTITL